MEVKKKDVKVEKLLWIGGDPRIDSRLQNGEYTVGLLHDWEHDDASNKVFFNRDWTKKNFGQEFEKEGKIVKFQYIAVDSGAEGWMQSWERQESGSIAQNSREISKNIAQCIKNNLNDDGFFFMQMHVDKSVDEKKQIKIEWETNSENLQQALEHLGFIGLLHYWCEPDVVIVTFINGKKKSIKKLNFDTLKKEMQVKLTKDGTLFKKTEGGEFVWTIKYMQNKLEWPCVVRSLMTQITEGTQSKKQKTNENSKSDIKRKAVEKKIRQIDDIQDDIEKVYNTFWHRGDFDFQSKIYYNYSTEKLTEIEAKAESEKIRAKENQRIGEDKLNKLVLNTKLDSVRYVFNSLKQNLPCIPHLYHSANTFDYSETPKRDSKKSSNYLTKANKLNFTLAQNIRYTQNACFKTKASASDNETKYQCAILVVNLKNKSKKVGHVNIIFLENIEDRSKICLVEPNGEVLVERNLLEYLQINGFNVELLKHNGIQTAIGRLPVCEGVAWWILYEYIKHLNIERKKSSRRNSNSRIFMGSNSNLQNFTNQLYDRVSSDVTGTRAKALEDLCTFVRNVGKHRYELMKELKGKEYTYNLKSSENSGLKNLTMVYKLTGYKGLTQEEEMRKYLNGETNWKEV